MEDRIQIVLEAIEIGRQRLDAAVKRIEDVTKAGKKQADATDKQDSALKKLIPSWTKIITIATAAATAVALLAHNQINAADAALKQADNLGTTIEKLSALKFAADLSRVGQEGMVQALTFLNRALSEAQDKSSNAAKGFATVGVKTNQANGDIRDGIDVLLEISDVYARTEGAAAKAELAQVFFGRGSKEMVNFLNQGSVAIQEQMTLAQELGVVYSQQTGESAAEFNDKVTILTASLKGIVAVTVAELLPSLIQMANIVLELARDKQNLADVTSALVIGFRFLIESALGVYTQFRLISDILANVLVLAWQNFNTQIEGGIKLFNVMVGTVKAVATAILDMVRSVAGFSDVFRLLFERDFSGAAQAAKKALLGVAVGAKDLINAQVSGVTQAGAVVVETALGTASNVKDATIATIQDITATATSAAAQINRVSSAAATAPGGPKQPPGAKSKLPSLAAVDEAKKRKDIADQLNIELLTSEGTRLQNADLLRQAAIAKELSDHQNRLLQINNLSFASEEERHRLLEQAEALHQSKILNIERDAQQEKLRIMAAQLDAAKGTFSGIADAIKEFGGEGTTAYKIFATAAAVIDTARAAIAAYSSTVGIPYVGPFLAPIAAGAAVAFGAAQIAKINGAFAEGGIVPGTPSLIDNRVVAVATGELILSTKATQSIMRNGGPGAINSLLAGQIPYGGEFTGGYVRRSPAMHFATGGFVGPTPDAGRGATNVDITLAEITDRQGQREALARDSALLIVDKLNRRGNRLKA